MFKKLKTTLEYLRNDIMTQTQTQFEPSPETEPMSSSAWALISLITPPSMTYGR